MSYLSQVAKQRALSRREFLRSAAFAGAGARVFGFAPSPHNSIRASRKTVVVTFGGGARDEETFAPEGQENIPHLLKELVPQATFFTQVVNRGILGHYVATASLATGLYESFDNFADIAPKNPTVFEYFRKGLGRPLDDAWVIAPSNGFNRIGQSDGSQIARLAWVRAWCFPNVCSRARCHPRRVPWLPLCCRTTMRTCCSRPRTPGRGRDGAHDRIAESFRHRLCPSRFNPVERR